MSTFQELLNKDNSISIHHRNFQVLATEMFKINRGLLPDILRVTFVPKISSYNLRRNNTFESSLCLPPHCIAIISRSKDLGFSATGT